MRITKELVEVKVDDDATMIGSRGILKGFIGRHSHHRKKGDRTQRIVNHGRPTIVGSKGGKLKVSISNHVAESHLIEELKESGLRFARIEITCEDNPVTEVGLLLEELKKILIILSARIWIHMTLGRKKIPLLAVYSIRASIGNVCLTWFVRCHDADHVVLFRS